MKFLIGKTMALSKNVVALIALFTFEAIVFFAQFKAQVAPYYPTGFDQLYYLRTTYSLLEAFSIRGWLGLFSQLADSPQGVSFQIQGALIALVGGPSRTAITSLNLIYFIAMQSTLFWTVMRQTNRPDLAWIAVALSMCLDTLFHRAGGMYDYRIDFAAMCLYGIWACAITNSLFFRDRHWSVLAGLLGALLVSMRFITITYLAPILLLLFSIIAWRFVRGRRNSTQLVNCFISGVVVVMLSVPLMYFARDEIFKYYVVGHITGPEKAIRAAEVGIGSIVGHLSYYPGSLLVSHLGSAFTVIGALAISGSLFGGAQRVEQLRRRLPDIFMQAVLIVIPIAVLTANEAKSPVVGNTVVVPVILLIVLVASAPVRRAHVMSATVLLAFTAGILAFIPNATSRQHSLSVIDRMEVDNINQIIVDYLVENQVLKPRVAFDWVDDYLNAGTIVFDAETRLDTKLSVETTLGSIFAIAPSDALAATATSDIVVLSDQERGRDVPYPFNQSMKDAWPTLIKYAEANLLEIASGVIDGLPYRIFAGANVSAQGLTADNWITSSGVQLRVNPIFLKKKPIIVIEGTVNTGVLGGEPSVTAIAGDGSSVPASISITGDHFRLEIDAGSQSESTSLVALNVEFDRYFVPNELGINADKRRLVVQAPIRRLEAR